MTKSALDSRFAGLKNFQDTLSNPYFQLAARNTLRFLAGSVPLLLGLCFLLSLMLFYAVRRENSAFILPMLLPSAAVVSVVRMFFDASQGPFSALGLEKGALALASVYFLFVWKNAGFQIILDLAALQRFLYMTLPWVAPTVGFGAVFAATQALKVYRETYLLYGEYPQNSVYFLQHYMNNHFYKLNYQRIASASLLLLAALLFVALAGERVLKRRRNRLA